MYRRYPHWLRTLIIACLLLNLGQLAYAAVPSLQDDCYQHCQMQGMSMEAMHGMQQHHSMPQHHSDGACCGGMQACGHCAHCSLVPLLSGPPQLTRIVIYRSTYSEQPVHPIAFVPPLHEHPPRV